MVASFESRKKMFLFIAFVFIIVGSNYVAHHFIYLPENEVKYVVVGSLIDFVIVIPALSYFFLFRKQRKIAPLIAVALVGFIVGSLIIPDGHLSDFKWVGWLLLLGELSLFGLELFILVKLVKTIRSLRNQIQHCDGIVPPSIAIWNDLDKKFAHHRIARVFTSEWMMLKHALGSFRKKPLVSERHFTAHQQTSIIAFYIMLIHAVVLETLGVHWLIHELNPVISWVMILLNIYTILFFIGEIEAIRLNPITVEEDKITIPFGLMRRVTVNKNNVYTIRKPENGEYDEKDKTAFHGILIDFEKGVPNVVIEVHEPVTVKYIYGFEKQVEKIYLKLDRPNEFLAKVKDDSYPVE